jgi:hypothetical protein
MSMGYVELVLFTSKESWVYWWDRKSEIFYPKKSEIFYYDS